MAWPAAGASSTIEVGGRQPFELLDLAEDEDVLDARRGRGDDVEHARSRPSRFEMRRMPWSSRYSTRASSGVSVRARTSPVAPGRARWPG